MFAMVLSKVGFCPHLYLLCIIDDLSNMLSSAGICTRAALVMRCILTTCVLLYPVLAGFRVCLTFVQSSVFENYIAYSLITSLCIEHKTSKILIRNI